MKITVRPNTCDHSIGEIAIEEGTFAIKMDYSRDDLAAELLSAHQDLFSHEEWLARLSDHLDTYDLDEIKSRLK